MGPPRRRRPVRRTKQGMWLNADQQSRVSQWLVEYTQQKLSLAS